MFGKTLLKRIAVSAVLTAAVLSTTAARSNAQASVHTGWNLFTTDSSGTSFGGVNMKGIAVGTYDFGAGFVNTGLTDTIIQRQGTASVLSTPGTAASIPIEVVMLQLRTVSMVDFGLGTDFYYVTLQSLRSQYGGGASVNPSTGTMTISFADPNGGTYDSSFDVFFDVRKGSLHGAIAQSTSILNLAADDVPWQREPPAGAVVIDGVNHNLNGSDTTEDFWPAGKVVHNGPHGVGVAAVPEPASIFLFGGGFAGILAANRRRFRRAK